MNYAWRREIPLCFAKQPLNALPNNPTKSYANLLAYNIISGVLTLRNRTEIENLIPSASDGYSFYDPSDFLHMDVKEELKSS
ncbi:hypothetical protein Tco_0763846 [Tanacetum coccineum]